MRSTARWVGCDERLFAPDATGGRVDNSPGDLPRLRMIVAGRGQSDKRT
jgi:hypothetical protein